ncbi:hypothetical protein RHODO2019_15490 [Rhodococcus antarcticus]|uniref:AAA domain-containing protein n=1 Tax=Rhodococcus antarcticus TaxID=2987751 RepID=A0ABY6NYR9_9NOCA|nr:hypothetical protein [Rhodococcus antarcticus]UZJ24515.1 hypothetical protein RHODO2019_15490 [Rhodococcus antarcticus]
MSLKRADILTFLSTVPSSRGKVFLDHTLESHPSEQAVANQQHFLHEAVLDAKRDTRRIAGVLATELSQDAPKSFDQIQALIAEHIYKGLPAELWDRVRIPREYEQHLRDIRSAQDRVAALIAQVNATHKRETRSLSTRVRATHQILGDVSDWLTRAFHDVTQAEHVSHIEATFGQSSDISIDIWVYFDTGARGTPQQVFSEGYQDLIALLYFLAVMRAAGERGQARVLILDDVLQSVDAEIRVALMYFIAEEFKEWQLFITVHDRLWRNQLRDVFQRVEHPLADIEIRGWKFSEGPRISTSISADPALPLWKALEGEDPHTVCGVAGRVLEQVSDRLSWTIPISVQRKRGDAYTLYDLWPGSLKELKRTSAGGTVMEIDKFIHLRNMAGAHYNEWAGNVPWSDVERFAWAVCDLVSKVFCGTCNGWIERRARHTYSCRCGHTTIGPVSY